MNRARTPLAFIGAVGIAIAALALLAAMMPAQEKTAGVQLASAQLAQSPALSPISSKAPTSSAQSPSQESFSPSATIATSLSSGNIISRIQNPYPFPPLSFAAIHEQTSAALVNILCTSGENAVPRISASGVVIDARGVILTNAHVAQYVLLANSGKLNLSCVVRMGSPARPTGTLAVLYIPPIWIRDHATDITQTNPAETGEHDYALLRVVAEDTSSGKVFPALEIDSREAIGFPGDTILAASYPAEFIGGLRALNTLYPLTSIAPVKKLLTYGENRPDVLVLSGVVEAQSGSSGGAIVNAWGRLIGLMTTSSEGASTAERTLHALTLSYINRDLKIQSGNNLRDFLDSNISMLADRFNAGTEQALTEILIDQISKRAK